ncbi:DUF2631 domain-containing protein [Bounagaea algeriensis]
MANTELEKKPSEAIDPAEEPSVEWGWHGGFPKGTQIAGWFCTAAMLLMLIGNHQGVLMTGQMKVAEYFLIIIAAFMVLGLLVDLRRKKKSWRSQ